MEVRQNPLDQKARKEDESSHDELMCPDNRNCRQGRISKNVLGSRDVEGKKQNAGRHEVNYIEVA